MKLEKFEYKKIDCLKYLKKMDGNSVDLIISSPPYNVGKEYETKRSIEEYLKWIKPILLELVRVLKDGGSLCWEVGNYVDKPKKGEAEVFPWDIYFYPIFHDAGLRLRNRIVWKFGHGLQASKRFSGRYETILWFTKGSGAYKFNLDPVRTPQDYPGKKYFKKNSSKYGQYSGNPEGKNPGDFWDETIARLDADFDSLIWDIPNVKNNHPEKVDHPCQFPIELVERCVLAFTDPGDVVFDPFAGVGSTLIAALMHGRKALGTELEQKYIDIGLSRIKLLENDELEYRPIFEDIYCGEPGGSLRTRPEAWSPPEKELRRFLRVVSSTSENGAKNERIVCDLPNNCVEFDLIKKWLFDGKDGE